MKARYMVGRVFVMWEHTPYLAAWSSFRALQLGVVHGCECVLSGTGTVRLPDGWWSDVWAHARDWDPGFCTYYGGIEEVGLEMVVDGRYDVAGIALSLYAWGVVGYYIEHCVQQVVRAGVRVEVCEETKFWEGLWNRWDDAVRTGPWDVV